MGIGLGFCYCHEGMIIETCERNIPIIKIAEGSGDRLLGGAVPLQNTFVIVRFFPPPGPCPTASFIVGQTYGADDLQDEGFGYWVCEFATEDEDWWYFERTGRANGIEIVLMISKTGTGVDNHAETVKLLVYDDTHYLNLIPKTGNPAKLVSTVDPILESSGLDWCDCPVDAMGLHLLPFAAARRFLNSSMDGVTKMTFVSDGSDLGGLPTNYSVTWTGWAGTNSDCAGMNGTQTAAVSSTETEFNGLIDGYCWDAVTEEINNGSDVMWRLECQPVRLGSWPENVLFTSEADSVPMANTYISIGSTNNADLFADSGVGRDVDSSDWSAVAGEFALTPSGDCETSGSLTAMAF